ncbi:rod shape-determining protein MreC [Nocardioides sp.]|uniref:rod shape-determining protein MreC n=1 Tax=Nocardioides sp. TaxID=35761 RepID=UPI003D13D7B6
MTPDKHENRDTRRPARSTLVMLLLACAIIITLDYRGGSDSPLEPARRAVGEALGPVESATSVMVGPFVAIPDWFHSQSSLRDDVEALQAENSELRQQVETADLDRNRLADYDALTRTSADTGYSLVPAHVIAYGPGQSFSRTVTIDAGTRAGVSADMTVMNNDGLVGRVVRATRTTATVLLIVDADSVVGGRVGRSMEVGFLRGRGQLGTEGDLDLDLVDDAVVPARNDTVVTWGSDGGAPYVAGIPIGRVTSVVSSPREQSQRAVIAPYVDFSALDLVGVVVAAGTSSDRSLVEAGGVTR